VPNELDKILILSSQPYFPRRLEELRKTVCEATTFNPISKEGQSVVSIFTKEFDKVELKDEQFQVSDEELQKAHKEIDKGLLASIRKAIDNVKKYQEEILIGSSKNCSSGTGIRYTPIERVGICVPGASAPLPSTVIMTRQYPSGNFSCMLRTGYR